MRRILAGNTALGLLVGAVLGILLAFIVHWCELPSAEAIQKRLAKAPAVAAPEEIDINTPPLSTYVFFGILYGGGLGSLIGTVMAATQLVVQAIRESKS